MANGDPLRIGITQPPDNRATAATMLVHTGSVFGTQSSSLWVHRRGTPHADAAVRGENFSRGAPGQTPAGVLGMVDPWSGGIGVVGASGPPSNLYHGETGVMGVATGFGVVGRATTGLILDEPGQFVSATGVVGECNNGVGVHGVATAGWGVIGQSSDRAGVTGTSVSGAGVEARSERHHGVLGRSTQGAGVRGESVGGDGVRGVSLDQVGVMGVTSQGAAGVRGQSDRTYGVWGEAAQGIGVFGTSPTNAIRGVSTGSGGGSIGVVGIASSGAGVHGDSATGIGVVGRSTRGLAAYFDGTVIVRGGLYVVGGPKAAAVAHPDGSHRSLYCVESPESYFEDFGEVTLTGPSVVVRIDKDFAAMVKRTNYHVFVTGYGPDALYVSKRGRDAFVIARVKGGTGSRMRVSYRLVARRADVKAARLPKVAMPPARGGTRPAPIPTVARRRASGGRLITPALEPLPARPRPAQPDIARLAKAKGVPSDVRARARVRARSASPRKSAGTRGPRS